jgi:hypothetical protein
MVICMFLRVLDPIKENYIESSHQNKHLDISCGRLSTSKDDYRCPTVVPALLELIILPKDGLQDRYSNEH